MNRILGTYCLKILLTTVALDGYLLQMQELVIGVEDEQIFCIL